MGGGFRSNRIFLYFVRLIWIHFLIPSLAKGVGLPMDNSKTENPNALQCSHYIVAIIDLLGISEALEKIKNLPESSDDEPEFIKGLKPTFGRVRNFRQIIWNLKNRFITKPQEQYAAKLTDKQNEIYKKYSSVDVDVEFFSDTALLKINLKVNEKYSPITSAWNLLGQLGVQMISFLAGGWPVRGAIEMGICAELEPHGLFGQAIARAHHIESRISDYPRIVIGGHFLKFLQVHRNIMAAEGLPVEEKKIILSFTKLIEDYLMEDGDGQIILDYLKKEKYGTDTGAFEESVKKGSSYIKGEILRFSQDRNLKLFNRYQKLKKYYQIKNCWRE